MTDDDLFPCLRPLSPLDDEQAIQRLVNICANSQMLVSIVGSSYAGMKQLHRVLRECQYIVEHRLMMNGGAVLTYKVSATNIRTRAKYEMIVTSMPDSTIIVNNCVLREEGDAADREAIQAYRERLKAGLTRDKEDI